ncbi:sensor domain-containing diguanylate cyclase [Franconibacter pulveris 1160]|uniref:Diguanylate cyclase n=1 Tax=Franconibacter pulveris TaxID=435910 RepID=A0A0J8Y646_9ENTR|nr:MULTISPECIES: sensor domain-containing diguanylate cyclase [Franconibacter]KMV32894.1 diguanylate cyclase [Franconibacter pulveris]MCK1968523.1 sensor domain-containing diguanylate cyclase [Franconibacter sp. IITDAS19]MEB5922643.1 sensor domain-containing diguanylate cyclase [Franconibacter daqui]
MLFPQKPANEKERLQALYMTDLLDKKDMERLDRLTRLASTVFGVPTALITLLDRDRQWMISTNGFQLRETRRDVSFCAHAILQQGVFVVPDATADPRFFDNPLVTGEPKICFYAGCPVRLPGGTIAGTICIIDTLPRDFSPSNVNTLLDLAAVVEDELYIISMAMSDSLTGLPNRRGFYQTGEKQFAALKEQGKAFSLLYITMNNLASINEFWGHAEGDRAIKLFAASLKKSLEPGNTLARLDGNQFAVLIEHKNKADADKFLCDFQARLDDYNLHSEKPFNINYAFGVIDSTQRNFKTLLEMVTEGDLVMHSENRKMSSKIG